MREEIWSFIELDGEKLHDTAPKMASEAERLGKKMGKKPCGVFFGPDDSEQLFGKIAPYGLERIYSIQVDNYTGPEVLMENLVSLALRRNPEVILLPATPLGKDIGARAAARMRRGFVNNAVDIERREGSVTARKPIYAGKAYGHYRWTGSPPYFAAMNLSSIEAVEKAGNAVPEVIHESSADIHPKVVIEKRWKVPLSELQITEANAIIGVGNGVESKSFVETIEKLAHLLDAVIGGTRVAVFRGFIPVERQIGSTGKFIQSDLYLAIGISGSNRHTSGIKSVKHVIPINKHKDAPIFKFAEAGVVGDLHQVVPELIRNLEESRALSKE